MKTLTALYFRLPVPVCVAIVLIAMFSIGVIQ